MTSISTRRKASLVCAPLLRNRHVSSWRCMYAKRSGARRSSARRGVINHGSRRCSLHSPSHIYHQCAAPSTARTLEIGPHVLDSIILAIPLCCSSALFFSLSLSIEPILFFNQKSIFYSLRFSLSFFLFLFVHLMYLFISLFFFSLCFSSILPLCSCRRNDLVEIAPNSELY